MPVWSLLLRIFLAVALMLNGVTSAMASVQMETMHAQAADTAAPMPCHQDKAHASGATTHAKASDANGAGQPNHPDCCKSSTCRCACVFSAQATMPVWSMAPAMMLDTPRVQELALGHAPPALPHLIRPPIA